MTSHFFNDLAVPLNLRMTLVHISDVKPVRLGDDTAKSSWSRIKTLNYASYAQLVRMVSSRGSGLTSLLLPLYTAAQIYDIWKIKK